MNLSGFIARRYLFSSRNRNAINIISGISAAGYGVGAFALVVILSVLNGFESILFGLYGDYNPDLKVLPEQSKSFVMSKAQTEALKKISGMAAYSCVYEENAVLRSGQNQVLVSVKGADSNYFAVSNIASHVIAGEAVLEEDGIPYCILGQGVDRRLNMNAADPESNMTLISPQRTVFSIARPEVNEEAVYLSGIAGLDDELGSRLVIAPLWLSQRLFERENALTSLEIDVDSSADENAVRAQITAAMGSGFTVLDRKQQQVTLYNMFRSEKWVTFAILVFVLFIISFNLVGSLTMLVLDKQQDIRTLRAMGARPVSVRNIILKEGLLISSAGTLIGLLLGVLLCFLQQRFQLIEMGNSLVPTYPVELRLSDIVLICVTTLLLGFGSAIYPALKAEKIAR